MFSTLALEAARAPGEGVCLGGTKSEGHHLGTALGRVLVFAGPQTVTWKTAKLQ